MGCSSWKITCISGSSSLTLILKYVRASKKSFRLAVSTHHRTLAGMPQLKRQRAEPELRALQRPQAEVSQAQSARPVEALLGSASQIERGCLVRQSRNYRARCPLQPSRRGLRGADAAALGRTGLIGFWRRYDGLGRRRGSHSRGLRHAACVFSAVWKGAAAPLPSRVLIYSGRRRSSFSWEIARCLRKKSPHHRHERTAHEAY